jgi:hypothetical protein
MSIHILFADLSKSTDPRGYMTRKLMDFFMTSGSPAARIADLVDRVYVPAIQCELPLVAQTDLPKFSEGQIRLLNEKIDMFRRKIDEISPLLIGEELLPDSDKCYILKSDFNDYKTGTPVFVRKTNHATLCYLYNLAEVTISGDFRYLPDVPSAGYMVSPALAEQPKKVALGVALWATLLIKVAEGILGAIGEKIGSELLTAIFPDQKPIDYNQMLKDFSVIVYGANLDQTISEQAGITNGVLTDNGEYYIPRKKAKAPKSELYSQLLNYHNKLTSVIGTMQYKDNNIDYTKKGLPVCVLAVDTQLAIYQELALQDPNVTDPQQSSNVEVIRLNAQKYAEYLESKVNEIVADNVQMRLNKITEVQNNPWCDGTSTGVVCKSRYFFADNEAGYRSGYYEQTGCKDDPESRCKDARNSYVDRIKSQTMPQKVGELKWALDIAANWKKLAKNPLPKV